MILGLLAAAIPAVAALAAPVYEAGREPPQPYVDRKERFDAAALGLDEYVANRGSASARPDGSGSAQSRLRLSLMDCAENDQARALGDAVLLTDRHRAGGRAASLEYFLGLERVSEEGHFLRLGRDEALALDQKGKSTRVWDMRLGRALHGEIWSVGAFVGWDFKNDGRPARPDNTGEAYLSYSVFGRMELKGPLFLEGTADFVTDAHRRRYAPAGLEGAVWLSAKLAMVEAGLGWRPWRTLDRRGVVDTWLASLKVRFNSETLKGPSDERLPSAPPMSEEQ